MHIHSTPKLSTSFVFEHPSQVATLESRARRDEERVVLRQTGDHALAHHFAGGTEHEVAVGVERLQVERTEGKN